MRRPALRPLVRPAFLVRPLAVLLAFAAGSAWADPPPWAPAHGHRARATEVVTHEVVREYRYVYYPAQQVYYAPESGNWFWYGNGAWQVGVALPGSIRLGAGTGGIDVMLHSAMPYREHVYVEETWGRPWRETHVVRRDDRDEGHGHGRRH